MPAPPKSRLQRPGEKSPVQKKKVKRWVFILGGTVLAGLGYLGVRWIRK